MIRRSLRQVVTALVLLALFVSQGTWALAGTTGGLTGTVIDASTSAPVAGAVVTVTSPSQTASVTTDAAGRFAFLTLAPDTYTVSVTKDNYQPLSAPGQIVFADSVQSLTAKLQKALTTIAHVTAVGAGALVKSGTTADVYSINASTQNAASALGGGGGLNSAYSAIATVPGAYVIPNQSGYYQTIHIRGGDYDQVGYEFDGVPVNRSFDNYPSSSASSLGNAEVQVYTGATPADSEGQGLAGYINQVIRTGTYPGFATADLGIGTPAFYHKAQVEIGGATPDRLFSYYVGVGGYNQAFNYVNNQNGSNYDGWQGSLLSVTPGCAACPYAGGAYYNMGPYNLLGGFNNTISARDVVVNTHYAIQHKNDSGRDDIQILWDSEALLNVLYSAPSSIASTSCSGAAAVSGPACSAALGFTPTYTDTRTWNCPGLIGTTMSQAQLNANSACSVPYYFPSAPAHSFGGNIGSNVSDTNENDQEIAKIQYTKNFGSTAFLRLYGYTYYSDWLMYGPNASYYLDQYYVGAGGGGDIGTSPDYELSSHTRGVSAEFQDQINAQNLVSVQGDLVTSNAIRMNNYTPWLNPLLGGGENSVVVNAAKPYSGYCYAPGTATAVNCNNNVVVSLNNLAPGGGGAPALPASCPNPQTTSTACTYLVAENGLNGGYNEVRPQFVSTSLTDEFRPTDKWLLNLGVRLDSMQFTGANTIGTGGNAIARAFWTSAFNIDNCVNAVTGVPFALSTPLGTVVGGKPVTCPAGSYPAYFQNASAQVFTYNIWQPRISGTYTMDPDDVIRFSYGRYTEAADTAFEQYNYLQDDLADEIATNFYAYGRTTPGYPIEPQTSINYDLSFEHHIKGTDWSFKLTPFLRQTQNQIQNFFLNQQTGFVSGLNAGDQRSQGFEFQTQKGDFSHNGFAGMLSFAYTDSYIHYGSLASGLYGTTVVSGTNATIANYNSYTKACAAGGAFTTKSTAHQSWCGNSSNGVTAAPCYTTGGAAQGIPGTPACTAADVANPYWNDPQSLIDPTQAFPTYSLFPGPIGASNAAYGVPYVSTLLLNYKHDKLAITPSFQFQGGGKYGSWQTNPGIDPAACTKVLPISGGNGASRYNAADCGVISAVPDMYTGNFDALGAFTQPNELAMNLQITYDVSPRVTLVGTFANIVNTCFGGTTAPWTFNSNHQVCGYATVASGDIDPIGNRYNPAGYGWSVVQPILKYPYGPLFGPYNDDNNSVVTPFQFYLAAKIKL